MSAEIDVEVVCMNVELNVQVCERRYRCRINLSGCTECNDKVKIDLSGSIIIRPSISMVVQMKVHFSWKFFSQLLLKIVEVCWLSFTHNQQYLVFDISVILLSTSNRLRHQ